MTAPRTEYPLSNQLLDFIATSQRFMARAKTLEERREAFRLAGRHFTPPAPADVTVDDLSVDGLPLRVYQPKSAAPEQGWPTLLYFHGGGWDLGGLDTHDWFAFALLRRLKLAIVSVDYRLAPEHPFPAPLEDGLVAWRALRAGKVGHNLSRDWLGVAGDSAGGTLAAALCHALRDLEERQPSLQVLVYPVLTTRIDLPSMQEHALAPLMTVEGLGKSLAAFLPDPAQRLNPLAMPLEAERFIGLAPAFIGVAEFDPLCDQGRAYHKSLAAAGVASLLYLGEGLLHSSLRAQNIGNVELFYDAMAAAVAAHLGS